MSEWVITNAYKQTKDGLERMGLINSHKELNQEIVGQLTAITEYLVANGITKFNSGFGVWMTLDNLEKEKKEYLKAVVDRGLEIYE